PVLLSILMPARLLNYNVMAICPLVVGLLSRQRNDAAAGAMLALFLAMILVNMRSPLIWHPLSPMVVFAFGTLAAAWGLTPVQYRGQTPGAKIATRVGIARFAALAVAGVAIVLTLRIHRPGASVYRDRTNDPFFAAVASETQGVVLTGGSYQL